MDSILDIQENTYLTNKIKSLEEKESELLSFKTIVKRDMEQFDANIYHKRSIIYDMVDCSINVKSAKDYRNCINEILSNENASRYYGYFNNILSEIESELSRTREEISSLSNENKISHILT